PRLLVGLVLGVVLALFAVCLVNALDWIGRPFSGLLVSENTIVVSMGRSDWAHMQFRDVPFSRVLAIDGRPVADGRDVHARVTAAGPGTSLEYTLLKGIDAFRLGLTVEYFTVTDFAALF